jgi:tryptophan synthase alpha chain
VNRIDHTFQELRPTGRLALIAYLTAGYPTLKDTPALVEAVAGAGADMIELGFPFSDPLADGPTIQAASQAALKQGVTVARALEAAAAARRRTAAPLLVMSYLNPVLAFGVEPFCRQAAQAGVDGLIIPDLPPEEAAELRGAAAQAGLDLVFFVAPTSTPARIRAAAKAATGFIYCVALTGVTGARDQLDPAVLPLVRSVKAETSLPVVVGFGLSRPAHLQALRGVADGAIVASALLDAIRLEPQDAVGAASRFVRGLEVR